MPINLQNKLAGKWEEGTRPKDLFRKQIAAQAEEYVPQIIAGLQGSDKKVQNGCAELASLMSEENPQALYAHHELFVHNLAAKEPVLRWEAVCTLGNFAAADKKKVLPAQLPKLFPLLKDKSIVLQNHTVQALTKIGAVYILEAEKILTQLLAHTKHFPGNRVGFIVEALARLVTVLPLRSQIRKFAETQSRSKTAVVAKKATKLLKLLDKAR